MHWQRSTKGPGQDPRTQLLQKQASKQALLHGKLPSLTETFCNKLRPILMAQLTSLLLYSQGKRFWHHLVWVGLTLDSSSSVAKGWKERIKGPAPAGADLRSAGRRTGRCTSSDPSASQPLSATRDAGLLARCWWAHCWSLSAEEETNLVNLQITVASNELDVGVIKFN